ncbi:uncharacterized protein LOC143182054 [Calliopsis andreniformis]|uniref:uncharacterized protein LOC143182054 n=1 Tax=Calliopsis andreniformis TaxID=337506 RepID=UPI003FCDD695
MSGSDNPSQRDVDCGVETTERPAEETSSVNMCIPKLEPYFCNASDADKDSSSDSELLVSPIPFTTPYKIRDPIILLEKCDKIWETLQLIKNIQSDKSTFDKLPSDNVNTNSYIKYQPVLGNDNAALPNFIFSIKTTKKLFHCSTCGKQYADNRTLRYHSERVHGIHIPPKRIHNNVTARKHVDREKEFNEIGKEKSSIEKPHLKKSESKQLTNTLTEIPSLQVTEDDTPKPVSHRRTRSTSIRNDNSPAAGQTISNEQEMEISTKDSKQNEKSQFSSYNSVHKKCILCKKLVKDIKRHLVDYHKIQSPNFMLKEMEKTPVVSQTKQLKKQHVNNEPLDKDEITKEYDNRKRKRKSQVIQHKGHKKHKSHTLNNNNTSSAQDDDELTFRTTICPVCSGIYSKKTFYKHARMHSTRGETKENFHLCNSKYRKSPIHLKEKTGRNSYDISSDNSHNYHNKNENSFDSSKHKKAIEEPAMVSSFGKKRDRSRINNDENIEAACSCGRLFRNPHTLFIHKANCNLKNKTRGQLIGKNKLNESDESMSGNSCDRDSGIGISITIKKKNDSYEVVDKNGNNENNLQDFTCLKDIDASSEVSNMSSQEDVYMEQPYEILELSKYSENHSILKLQLADEDIDVDIEEDSQSSFCNNNTKESLNDSSKENREQEAQNKDSDTSKFKETVRNTTCVCSKTFDNNEALEVHINEHHRSSQLNCGYCKEIFVNVSAWQKHVCSVQKGSTFIDLPLQIVCPHCNGCFNSYKTFDSHIKFHHSDSIVPYQCFQCIERFPNPTARRVHWKEKHGIPVCTICKMECHDIMKPRHDAYHYGLGFPCHQCKKAYVSNVNLLCHNSKVHQKVDSFNLVCEMCNLSFFNMRDFNVHKHGIYTDNKLKDT